MLLPRSLFLTRWSLFLLESHPQPLFFSQLSQTPFWDMYVHNPLPPLQPKKNLFKDPLPPKKKNQNSQQGWQSSRVARVASGAKQQVAQSRESL